MGFGHVSPFQTFQPFNPPDRVRGPFKTFTRIKKQSGLARFENSQKVEMNTREPDRLSKSKAKILNLQRPFGRSDRLAEMASMFGLVNTLRPVRNSS